MRTCSPKNKAFLNRVCTEEGGALEVGGGSIHGDEGVDIADAVGEATGGMSKDTTAKGLKDGRKTKCNYCFTFK